MTLSFEEKGPRGIPLVMEALSREPGIHGQTVDIILDIILGTLQVNKMTVKHHPYMCFANWWQADSPRKDILYIHCSKYLKEYMMIFHR